MRLAYLGTSEFAAAVLRRLAASAFAPSLVIAPPDRPKGRGRNLSPPPVALAASELGLELHQTPAVNEPASLAVIAAARIELGMVCAFGQLIKPALLDAVEMLNVHPSLLPRWRGAAPIERAIMAGDAETGVAIMRLTEGLDSGPVALCEAIPIEDEEGFGTLSARLAERGAALAVKALGLHARGELSFRDQDDSSATYADKIGPAERRLDPTRGAEELWRTVRALNPHIGTYLELDGGDRLGVAAARRPTHAALAPGALAAREGSLLLGTAEGTLPILRVKPAGKREMASSDYLRGTQLPRLAV